MIPSIYSEICSEAYVVEKTVEVVVQLAGKPETIRIEVLRDLRDEHYCTRAYRQEFVTLQPTYPQTKQKFDWIPEKFLVWVDYSLPLTHRDEADKAISQALRYLAERCDK